MTGRTGTNYFIFFKANSNDANMLRIKASADWSLSLLKSRKKNYQTNCPYFTLKYKVLFYICKKNIKR